MEQEHAHDDAYVLMMDALDGELTEAGREDLVVHLQTCPSCAREWQALITIDTLFRQTPALTPAADFTQRAIARLPSRRLRLWFVGITYVLALFGGIIPFLLGLFLVRQYQPLVTETSWLSSVLDSAGSVFQILGTVLQALLTGAGQFTLQQPAVIGGLLMLIGVVAL